jgi:hypothetical protein
MNITTSDRPIDVKRYISFKGIWWTTVQLQYPNLYNVEVYKRDGNAITLKTADEIKQSIVEYLQTKIEEYNSSLAIQNVSTSWHLAANSAAYSKLWWSDSNASVANRQYAPLSIDFLVSAIWDKAITQLAQTLYLKNSGWPAKLPTNTVWNTISVLENQFSIANKIYATVENHIVVWQAWISVNTTWYEAWYIRSNWSDNITNNTVPWLIQEADARIQSNRSSTNLSNTNSDILQNNIDQTCWVSADWSVPLLKWPKALTCRWKNLRATSLKDAVKISYKNAQWPVLPLSQFKDTLDEQYADYGAYVQNVLWWNSVIDYQINTLSIETPSQKVIRWWQLPITLLAKNTKWEAISSLLFPIQITTDQWELIAPWKTSTLIETAFLDDVLFIDTREIPTNVNKITLKAAGNNLSATKEILIVEWTIQTRINNQPITSLTIPLANTGSNTINVRLVDQNWAPLSAFANIASTNWLVQPWTIVNNRFTPQNYWEIKDGIVNVALSLSMKAGKDSLVVSVPWIPDKIIDIEVLAGSPFRVSVSDDQQSSSPWVRFSVQDKRGNTLSTPVWVQYTILWDATSNNQKQWTITVSDSTPLPLSYGTRWGTLYVYWALWWVALSAQEPWYLRKDLPTNLWPKSWLNIVYLTLEGTDRWSVGPSNTASDIITSSPKTIAVTTALFDEDKQYPVLWVITPSWELVWDDSLKTTTGDNGRINITKNNSVIWYIDTQTSISISNIIIQNSSYGVIPSWVGW